MITPLMLILSSLDENYKITLPFQPNYLKYDDKMLIQSEALRLCERVKELVAPDNAKDKPLIYEDTVLINGKSITLSPYTVELLKQIAECSEIFIHTVHGKVSAEVAPDLSNDYIVLRIGSNPQSVYNFVYQTMSANGLSYDEKIAKIDAIRSTLINSNIDSTDKRSKDPEVRRIEARIDVHSDNNYWRELLVSRLVKQRQSEDVPSFTPETINTIKSDLKMLGIYGFVNPKKLYDAFKPARAESTRKMSVDKTVITYLNRVCLSGGLSQ